MNPTKKWTKRLVISALPVLVMITFAQATPDESPCGIIVKSGEGSQIIPKHGNVQSKFVENAPVTCASMVITHQDPFWIKLADQSIVKIGPHSFVEIPKFDSKAYHIYRGEVMLTSAPGIAEQVWTSPNSEVIFKGGVSFMQYKPEERVTVVSSFNREVEFRNKFNSEAGVTVRAGEMSHLAIQEANVVPSQPAVMNQATVTLALAGLKLSESDQTELGAVVKRVYDDRAKSLTSELQDWNAKDEDEVKKPEPARTIASVKVKGVAKPEKALSPEEAEFVKRKMYEHLYGDATDAKIMELSRKPASAVVKKGLEDGELQKQHKNLKLETKRIDKEIERLDTNDE